jgi:hypothetical protein
MTICKLEPHQLTFIAERLGRRSPPPLRWLILLSRHASPVVREGAVYGLAPHAQDQAARIALEGIAASDPSPEVRSAAREVLEP